MYYRVGVVSFNIPLDTFFGPGEHGHGQIKVFGRPRLDTIVITYMHFPFPLIVSLYR